ncbi:MAG: bifunctional nuclease family protein [Anaerolineae bacterium]|nr:bifunctional nuclease family protein [Anaerolineae bacterium]
MVEVVIDSVRVSLTNQQRIVVLRENNAERYLPIWIGPYEAEAITIALQEVEVARPQTHDLLKNVLKSLNARLSRVEIISLREDVFYGNLVVETDGQIINIDSRPSDAIALAVRWHVPILVAQEVLQIAGIIPEQEIAEQDKPTVEEPNSSEEPLSDERLSVFDDFLKNLDIGDSPDSSSDEDTGEENPKPDKL